MKDLLPPLKSNRNSDCMMSSLPTQQHHSKCSSHSPYSVQRGFWLAFCGSACFLRAVQCPEYVHIQWKRMRLFSLCIIYRTLYLWHEPIYYIGTYMRTSISILKTSCSVCTCCGSLRDLSGCRSKLNPINMWRSSTVKCGACTTSHALLLWRPPSQPAGI